MKGEPTVESSWVSRSANAVVTCAKGLSPHWVAFSSSKDHSALSDRKAFLDFRKAGLKYRFQVFLAEINPFGSTHRPRTLENKASQGTWPSLFG